MNKLFIQIINMSISASWLILAVLILRLILKKAPKWVNVLLWGIVAVRLLCPLAIESNFSLIPSAQTIPTDIELYDAPVIDSGIAAINDILNPILSQTAAPEIGASVNPLQIVVGVGWNVWILGATALLAYAAISYLRLRRKVDTAILYRDNIFQSEYIPSPFVLGIFRPQVYLPFSLDGQDRDHVIAHELSHIRRRDHWWKPLGFLLLSLHWFNPLMWLAYILLCRDIELACDEKVIHALDNDQRADYSQALLTCSIHRGSIAACPLAFGEVGVKERVKSVLHYKKPAFWVIVISILICIAVGLCFLTDPPSNSYTPSEPTTPTEIIFDAEVLEVYDSHLLVEPLEESPAYMGPGLIEVPLTNLGAASNPAVGDIIRVTFNGLILETYPARIQEIYSLEVIQAGGLRDLIPMVMVNGVLYLDAGTESTAEGRCGILDGEITSAVEPSEKPTQDNQSNFGTGYGYQYGETERTIEVLIDGKWWIFATEEVRQETPPSNDPKGYYLTIGEEGVVSIEIQNTNKSGGCANADGSPFRKGERVWLDPLDGCTNLRGVTITALDKDGIQVWRISIPDQPGNQQFAGYAGDGWALDWNP